MPSLLRRVASCLTHSLCAASSQEYEMKALGARSATVGSGSGAVMILPHGMATTSVGGQTRPRRGYAIDFVADRSAECLGPTRVEQYDPDPNPPIPKQSGEGIASDFDPSPVLAPEDELIRIAVSAEPNNAPLLCRSSLRTGSSGPCFVNRVEPEDVRQIR